MRCGGGLDRTNREPDEGSHNHRNYEIGDQSPPPVSVLVVRDKQRRATYGKRPHRKEDGHEDSACDHSWPKRRLHFLVVAGVCVAHGFLCDEPNMRN